ncbi:PGF-pre-PGF domain-containing protein [Methanosarcina sp. MSH10X1]|nr:PGF-pre-PGF domain-containing protein [Methanosarcina sp. MSH10X1]
MYTVPGTFRVNLTAFSEDGSTATKTASITVLERSSSSGGSSNGGSGSNGGSCAGGSPEPAKNVEIKELSRAFITGGKPVRFDFTKNATSILSIAFDSKKTSGKTTTIVEVLKDRSTLTSDTPEDEVYGYLNIWVGNSARGIESNLENAVIHFRVEKSWIEENDIDQASIVLNRYNDSKWNPLSTGLSGEDDRYLYFTAETPGFSPFAITGKTKASLTEIQSESGTEVPEQNNENKGANVEYTSDQKESTGIPGFEIIYGITGLLAVHLYRKKQK